jgi:hypothetical protein
MGTAGMLGMMAGTTAISVGSDVLQGFQAKDEGENLATQYNYQAKEETQAASAKIISDDYKVMNVMGRINAGAAASGFTSGGSSKYVMANTVENARINDMYTRYSGRLASSQSRYAGQMASWQGNQQFWGKMFSAASTAMGAGMKGYQGVTTGDWASTMGG